jgi:D-alanine-D-alanine ligase
MHVAVLTGGIASEREVCLVSGTNCAKALRDLGYQVTLVDADKDVVAKLQKCAPDVALNTIWGQWGEDGTVQGILEGLRIPYSHSSILASALAMDKYRAKRVLAASGLQVASDHLYRPGDSPASVPLTGTLIIKPNFEGSSIGMARVNAQSAEVEEILEQAQGPTLVEQYIEGRDLTVGVLDGAALGVSEVLTSNGIWDYKSKFGMAPKETVTPAEVPVDLHAEICRQAETAHEALGCEGLTRVDFRWDDARGTDGLYVIELNTQPAIGFPRGGLDTQLELKGYSLGQICEHLIKGARLRF